MQFYEGVDFIRISDCQWDESRDLKLATSNVRDSLLQLGQMTPISVINRDSHFEVIDGIQRVRAMRQLGWKMVVAKCITEEEAYEFAETGCFVPGRTPELVSGGRHGLGKSQGGSRGFGY